MISIHGVWCRGAGVINFHGELFKSSVEGDNIQDVSHFC